MTSIRPTVAVARAKRRDGCLDGGHVAKELLAVDAHLARRTAAAFAGRVSGSGSRGSSPSQVSPPSGLAASHHPHRCASVLDRRDAPYHAGGESSHSFMNPPRESKSPSRATCPRSGGCLTRTLSTGEVMQWWRPGKATCRLGMYPRDETKAVDGFQWSCCCLGAIVPVRCPITCSSSRVHVLFTTASLLDIPDRRPLRIEPPRR